MSSTFAYVELIKFRYHVTYLTVVFAALIFAGRIDLALCGSLLQLYVSFNVLFYGGIYTLNDLRDLESDRRHPRKKNRPLASGRVRHEAGWAFAVIMISAGLAGVVLRFGTSMSLVCFGMLALNLVYSFGARDIPYLDIAVNTATHPLRFLLGVLLVGRDVPLLHLGAYFCFVFGLSCLRRELERDLAGWEARPVLKSYSLSTLRGLEIVSLIAILLFLVADAFVSKGFYAVILTTYALLILGARFSPPVRAYLHHVWTR